MRDRHDTLPEPSSAPAQGTAPSAYLEVLSGPEDGKICELCKPVVTIGRIEENDVCVPLELSISRRHARLSRGASGYLLEVLTAARNGAEVNGRAVAPGESAEVAISGEFTLGDVRFRLEDGGR
jgi:pSer/pThr/pTyr-binding forkhead associated (FHA) protein